MKITHIVPSIDEEASGPSYSVPSMVAALNARSHEANVATLSQRGLTKVLGAPVSAFQPDAVWPPFLRRLGRSKAMQDHLARCESDIFHTHGLWMMPTVYPAWQAQKDGTPLVWAPRGMLGREALAYSRPIKKAFGFAYQNRALQAVSCFHATAESELEDIRAFGLRQPVAIVPNGIDLPTILPIAPGSPDLHPYILSLGRIHPKKALDRLISAFALMSREFADWRLRIVGPSEVGYAEELKAQASRLGLTSRISIEEPVFGCEKTALMRNAELFALSTLHENFAMTVAESLAVETPVISTRGAPWHGLEGEGCGWWIDHGVEPMASALREAMSLSSEGRAEMGRKGREWMKRDFAWSGLAEKMERVYGWLLGDEPRPEFVKLVSE